MSEDRHYSIITGAGSGLGLALAKELDRAGIPLILAGRDPDKLEHTKSILTNPHRVECHALDISSESDVSTLFENLTRREITLKHLFNVAGSAWYGTVADVSRTAIDEVLRANLTGLMLVSSFAATYMKEHRTGHQRIVSVLSTAALKGKKNESIYYAAKWGARGFLESLRDEVSADGIEVINVFPGGMQTPFWNNSPSGYDTSRFMNPDDVARHIARAALDEEVFVSDMTINRPL